MNSPFWDSFSHFEWDPRCRVWFLDNDEYNHLEWDYLNYPV
jgi:hypothetical protein